MGRYYNTNSGREGKFMFGVQPSDDPGEMGMREQDPTMITYYADDNDVELIKENLDKQYEVLGVPKADRIYYCKTNKEMADYEDKTLRSSVWVDVREDDEVEMKKHEKDTRWYCPKDGYVSFEIPGKALALARVRLALIILSDIKDEGYCSLDAEL